MNDKEKKVKDKNNEKFEEILKKLRQSQGAEIILRKKQNQKKVTIKEEKEVKNENNAKKENKASSKCSLL